MVIFICRDYNFFILQYLFVIDLCASTPVRPPGVETAELLYVNTREKLQLAISELRSHSVIGIDVEAHAFRYS